MSGTSDFEMILRRLGRRERVRGLMMALGLEPRLEPVEIATAATESGVLDGVRSVFLAGERGTMRALLLELRAEPSSAGIVRLARAVRAQDLARQHLFVAAGPAYRRLLIGCFGLEGDLRHLTIERARVRATDVEALEEMVAAETEGGLALALRYARALDRTRVTHQFFADFGGQRARVAASWKCIPPDAGAEREQLALLFLCRMMFLYFLQRRGHLAGDASYLSNLWRRWCTRERNGSRGTFYRAFVEPLFFGALNRRPEDRDAAARSLGAVPYLNGGLFERHVLERTFRRLDLPDDVVGPAIEELFEKYRFTTRDAAEELLDGATAAGVDPEMLGRVFEGMMAVGQRGDTGTYYTPSAVVDRLVGLALAQYIAERAALPAHVAGQLNDRTAIAELDPMQRAAVTRALHGIRVLDPACGSGAFLLGALSRLARIRLEIEGGDPGDVRRDIVGRSLHGVDIQGDAAMLCALRLWLALAIDGEHRAGDVPPLPNLDRRVRQGDALLDPLDLGDGAGADAGPDHAALYDARVRGALRELAPAGRRYLTAEPEQKDGLRRQLDASENALAGAWLAALGERVQRRLVELRSLVASRDLFGDEVAGASAAKLSIPRLEARRAELESLARGLRDHGALPFFSFRVHFAEAGDGFDLIVSNPPWVRAHRWPASVGRLVRRRFAVCREPGWRYGATLGGAPAAAGAQVDLSQLFLERSISLLSPGGVLALMVPAKTFRSLYGGPARRMLLRETRLVAIEDHSLDQRSVFEADAFAGAVIARRIDPDDATGAAANGRGANGRAANAARVTLIRRRGEPLRFDVPHADLPLFTNDPEAPWLLVPPEVRRALRRMQAAGPPLGTLPGLRVRRGVFTGANHVLLVRDVTPRLSGLCRMRAEGYGRASHADSGSASAYEAVVESAHVRPLIRGCDVSAWRFATRSHVIWIHDEAGAAVTPPQRLRRYLARHDAVLRARSGVRPGTPPGALFRVSVAALGHKVVWHDLAETLNAVAVPALVSSPLGENRPVIPLNTVYFVPTSARRDALLLAAYLNALPARVFARAIAERAKDARFRFFAWTVAAVPLPLSWSTSRAAERLLELSRKAHEEGGITQEAREELDGVASDAYALATEDREAMSGYDRWLRGLP